MNSDATQEATMAPGLTGFDEWLRLAMQQAGVSKVAEVARRAGVQRSQVYRVLNGEGVRFELIELLADALGVPAPHVQVSFGRAKEPTSADLIAEIERLTNQLKRKIREPTSSEQARAARLAEKAKLAAEVRSHSPPRKARRANGSDR